MIQVSITMMSMFSSFDAPSAESLGQKLRLLFSASKEGKSQPQVESKKKREMSEGSNDESSTSSSPKSSPENINKPSQQQQMRLRFAPELDGVHCFETIITY
ncbi:hypothetical protein SADUNF_Sadunf12G0007100 [Salix dunnii]|uniref:Uncharacterized protein n=1 Tax=Salix dunnii TaxID=1413687 RepID=A0A835JKQ7_9ROSI|nr:hypothetical protein SADUNF_Sadunf12G0007100 [Salix dunnii]